MDTQELLSAVRGLPYGKRLPTAVYIFDLGEGYLPKALDLACAELRNRCQIGAEFNVLKFHTDSPKISFLSYPNFWDDAHPSLRSSVVVDLVRGSVRRDSYSSRLNPPILHRKETFLPKEHPCFGRFSKLSAAEEAAGMLEDGSRIGFKLNWERQLVARGYVVQGHELLPANSFADQTPSYRQLVPSIDRHRTALARTEASKPTKILLELGQLRSGESFFDYGCGLGSDVTTLLALGYTASGWDPVHRPDSPKREASVVNLGFVLNVIEDPAERIEVLLDAWQLTQRLLIVSTLVDGQQGYNDFRCCGDGLITSRNTFQKFYSPAELRALIEDSLGCECIPVAMGIYFVFRRIDELQDFLCARSRRSIDWTALSYRLGLRSALRVRSDPYLTHRELLDAFWDICLDLGRVPRSEEFERLPEVRSACGSIPGAFRLFFEKFGEKTFEAARQRRRDDLLVFMAAGQLRKRVPLNSLSVRLQRDIKSFFRDYSDAQDKARDVMFAAGDKDEIDLAVAELKLGWIDRRENHLIVHRSLIDELPTIFRVYVECGARLFGNPREADLIKIHLYSGKLTFQHYDDFDGAALPKLRLRIKIDLRKLFVSVFDHTQGAEQQVLFFKERFVADGYQFSNDAVGFSSRLRGLGFSPETIGHGPNLSEFQEFCRSRNLDLTLSASGSVTP